MVKTGQYVRDKPNGGSSCLPAGHPVYLQLHRLSMRGGLEDLLEIEQLKVNPSPKEVLSRLIIQLDDIIHKNSKFQLAKWRLGHGIEKGRASE